MDTPLIQKEERIDVDESSRDLFLSDLVMLHEGLQRRIDEMMRNGPPLIVSYCCSISADGELIYGNRFNICLSSRFDLSRLVMDFLRAIVNTKMVLCHYQDNLDHYDNRLVGYIIRMSRNKSHVLPTDSDYSSPHSSLDEPARIILQLEEEFSNNNPRLKDRLRRYKNSEIAYRLSCRVS